MNPLILFGLSIGLLLLGVIVTAVIGNNRKAVGPVAFVFLCAAALGITLVVIRVFSSGTVTSGTPLWRVPGINASLVLHIDPLSALFLALIALISVLTAFYSLRYMQIETFARYSLRTFYPILLLFFAGVMGVVVVSDIFFFVIFWEVMTLASYVLVVFERENKDRLRAGFKYFLYTHIATSLMIVAAIILYIQVQSFSFDGLSRGMAILARANPALLHLVLLFFFLGFATKAGILPMGSWLPDAYPAAPAPATAAFAGTMTKLGIYGLIRIFIDILPAPSFVQTWAIIIAVVGSISIFVGTLTALAQDDAKKLLAFSTIGQMGYLLLGIGICGYFMESQPVLAVVALAATLFHLINSASYKSCLFLNAGSMYYKVGTMNLNAVGGLVRILPLTAALTIIVSLAIAGIPPLNGFASKWLIYQSAIRSGSSNPLLLALGLIAIFISVVTLAVVIKLFGSAFYGKYADNGSKAARGDVPLSMMIPQATLALLCIALGVLPILPLKLVYSAVSSIPRMMTAPAFAAVFGEAPLGGLAVNYGDGVFASWNPVLVLILGAICVLIGLSFFRAGGATARVDETWYCGEAHSDEEVRYQASSYFLTFKQMFRMRIGSYDREGVYPTLQLPKFKLTERNWFKRLTNIDQWLYVPLVDRFMNMMRRFSTSHSGIPQVYLLWLVIGTLAAIAVLFLLAGYQGHL